MDHERCIEDEKTDEFMLPGFRFHPTDEELVGFYLRRKIMQKPLSIELIKQLDIYKYDPWDLPKLATTGEKEWYFYCPRDRKYRNSTRPNRVTGAGFWKATGTDRPIYSAEGSKCIGLKKSLVFYKGRAAKGVKTDWMMHEFRLPSVLIMLKKHLDKNIPANEAWAICRIFKKASSSTQKALSNSWVPPLFDITTNPCPNVVFDNIDFIATDLTTKPNPTLHFGLCNNMTEQLSPFTGFPPLQLPPHKPPTSSILENNRKPSEAQDSHEIPEMGGRKCSFRDASSLLLDISTSFLGGCGKGSDNNENMDFNTHFGGFSTHANVQEEGILGSDRINVVGQGLYDDEGNDELGLMKMMMMRSSMGYSWNGPLASPFENGWKSGLVWDYASPCPSDLSTSYNCYT